ncbi:AAA family ATPase [Desulfonema magnum]|uniref:AAA ATPase-like domain-containing protein n=1 Tax=Desulfonema magnum TaxID=45655 RepID=A0A975BYV9_9BACT|nr:AAA family ATPase [Desulfonema magnum]QTA93474.1 AAA ATPase-like domain-containing protein [Desulfonema magnum]
MKVESVSIQKFKLFENLDVSFKNKTIEEVTNRFVILGDNGTGKTTLLQAVALPLALATRSVQSVFDFDWIGFLAGRFWKWGAPRIELQISFEDEELEATRKIARIWYDSQSNEFRADHSYVEPGDSHSVKLILDGDYWKAGEKPEERMQFQGRYYARSLLRTNPSVRSSFSKLPGIFWFDQFRNLGSGLYAEKRGERSKEQSGDISFEFGAGRLRQYLIDWKRRQESGTSDYLMALENYYKKIFPGRSFSGVEEMPSLDSPVEQESYFVLNDGHHTYDIAEMSAGEQSVFPILYEFVRQQIAYSVVLIDEIDLNLHPPAAQFLVSQLPKIGHNCQFIFTTHSDAVNDVIGEPETYRLTGGSLCL